MNDFVIKKNLLDLEHSEKLSKGITEIGIASGSFVAISVSILNKDLLFAIVIAALFSSLFLLDGIRKLNDCKKIRDEIKLMINISDR